MIHTIQKSRRPLLVALCLGLLWAVMLTFVPQPVSAATTVTPGSPDGWAAANVAGSATVGITTNQPKDGLGSLKFTSPGSTGKADFQKTWTDATRTLGALDAVSFDYYRDLSSTALPHFSPAFRLLFWQDLAPAGLGAEDHVGYLVWEFTYNTAGNVPTNSWQAEDLMGQDFWMRYISGPNNVGGCSRTIQNFDATLGDWLNGNPQGQAGDCVAPDLDANTYITGVIVGIGSGWSDTYLGYVDNVLLGFGADQVSANFEPNPVCTTICYADTVNGNDANGGASATDAKKTIQAAVTAVQSGGQVIAAAGTYAETVTVNKPLTITGAGTALTIIDPPSGNGMAIRASNITIKDLQITGAGQGANLNGAIANITFDNVHFLNNTSRGIEMQATAVTGLMVLNSLFDNNNIGIRMATSASATGITIDNTTFQNHAGSAFQQSNDNTATGWVRGLTVRNSTFTANGVPSLSGSAGVYAEEFNNVLIENSTFTGNRFGVNLSDHFNTAPITTTKVIVQNNIFSNHQSSTIALRANTSDPNLGSQLFTVKGNTITQDVGTLTTLAQAHLAITTSSSLPNGIVDVSDNSITFSGTYPVSPPTVSGTYGIYIAGGSQTVNVKNNTLNGGNVGTNGATIPTSGIRIVTSIFQTSANIDVTKNTIINFVNGVAIHDGNNAWGGVESTSTISITRNDLSGNTEYGIRSGAAGGATVAGGTCNWWGDASGPSGEGSGTGTQVSTHVDYAPWLYSNDLDGDCFIGGTIKVAKSAPGGGTTQFEFDPSWSTDNFKLVDGGYLVFGPLPAGAYAVSEVNLPVGWSLQSATCDNRVTQTVETVNPANITLADGDSWDCTFTNAYTPPPTNVCAAGTFSNERTNILGIGMGNPQKHKNTAKITVPNWANLTALYGQMVAVDNGAAKYVRFIMPGKKNWTEVGTITSYSDHSAGNFWYGADIDPALMPAKSINNGKTTINGRWFLQKSGTKGHIPRALVLYPTYAHPTNNYVNVFETFGANEGEVYWDTASGWTQSREIVVPIAPPQAATTFHVELALADNDKDARPVWITVTAGGITQTVTPNNPDKGDQLNILVFDLNNVPAGTDEITIEVYSPSMAADGIIGDSAALVGMTANYACAPLNN